MKDHYCFFPPKRVIKVSLTSERNTIITLHSSVILFYFIQSHLNFVFLKEKERASLKGHGDGAGIAEGLWPSGGSGCAGLCRTHSMSAPLATHGMCPPRPLQAPGTHPLQHGPARTRHKGREAAALTLAEMGSGVNQPLLKFH